MRGRPLAIDPAEERHKLELFGIKFADAIAKLFGIGGREGRSESPERALRNGALRGAIESAGRLPGDFRIQEVKTLIVRKGWKPRVRDLPAFRPVLRVPRE